MAAFRSARTVSAGHRTGAGMTRDEDGRVRSRTNTATVGGADWDDVKFVGPDGRREVLAVVVRLRVGSGKLMRKFDRFCAFNAIDAECVDAEVGDVWLCWGHPAAVTKLVAGTFGTDPHPAVIEWHYPMSAAVPARACGSGTAK